MAGTETPIDLKAPVSRGEFADFACGLDLVPPAAVAVSGGGDSMALLLLARDWIRAFSASSPCTPFDGRFSGCQSSAAPLTALTVDHGLRPESREEARWVAAQAKAIGVPHITLCHRGPVPSANIQAKAREIRYRLLEGWCRRHAVPLLMTAHTLEDQAETFLIRLIRGSGVDGLSGMPDRTVLRDGAGQVTIEVVRPLLHVPKERLRATLREAGLDWLEDPSNEDDRYTRVRIRRMLDLLAREGLTTGRLAATANRMQRSRRALDHACQCILNEAVAWDRAGFALVDLTVIWRAPEDVGLRLLRRIVQAVGGQPYPPRHDRLLRVYEDICAWDGGRTRTLGGCRIAPVAGGEHALVTREARNQPAPMPITGGEVRVWDGRFRISLPRKSANGVIRSLGREGLRLVRDLAGAIDTAAVPPPARASLPSLWRDGDPIAVPHLGIDFEDTGFRAAFLCDGAGHLDAFAGPVD